MWKPLAGTSTAAGGWEYAALTTSGTTITPICARITPYQSGLRWEAWVQAGDVIIGYLGRTGYSRTENTNNINDPHLHFWPGTHI